MRHPTYRPDIDGLRAVAVLSVLAFHALPGQLSGGFIGVDIFFGISGYLIGGIIFSNLEKSSFSFSEFYARRIKRIFPALILVLASCFAFGWITLLADEYEQLGLHIASGAGFVSNFTLWHEAGYFDSSSWTKPLLHLWSLGIEEQFYIVWPLLLWFAFRTRINAIFVCTVVILLSFSLGVYQSADNPVGAFYSPLTRLWELICGSLLAYLTLHNPSSSGKLRNACNSLLSKVNAGSNLEMHGRNTKEFTSALGTGLICISLWAITKQTPFPGWWAIAPIMGALLIIASGPEAFINRRVLANPVMVWIGLISYPLYLWHWPILSFLRLRTSEDLSALNICIAVIYSFVLAWLTYTLIERPLRFGKLKGTRARTLALGMLVIGSAGMVVNVEDGVPSRLPKVLQEAAAGAHLGLNASALHREWRFKTCYLNIDQESFTFPAECTENTPGEQSVFLWGDSNASALIPGLREMQKKARFTISQFTGSSCYPGRDDPLCMNVDRQAMEAIRHDKPEIILIHAMWGDPNPDFSPEVLAEKLSEKITYIRSVSPDSRIILIGPVPRWKKNLIRLIYEDYQRNHTNPIRLQRDNLYQVTIIAEKALSGFSERMNIEYISAMDRLCDKTGCLTQIDGHLTAYDSVHLTREASIWLVESIEPRLGLPPRNK